MLHFADTKVAGQRAEQEVKQILMKFTKHVYANVRVDTLFTKSGTTEIDIVAAVANVLLVIEVKNVSLIEGKLTDAFWYLTGMETGQRYSALNTLTQNRIHTRSLKDAWFANRGELPPVVSVVVVPNGCHVPEELAPAGVLTMQQFTKQLAQMANNHSGSKYGYALDYVFQNDNTYLERKDFTGGLHG